MTTPAEEHVRLALQHHQAGRHADAEDAYRRVLAADPQHAGALHGLGALALQADEPAVAEQLIRRAIAVRGEWPEACYHLGVALQGREQFDEAIAAFRRAAALNPALFDAHYQMAVCLQLTGQRVKAIAEYRQAIALRANDPLLLTNFAIALQGGQDAGQCDEAIAALRQATALKPDFAEAFIQLGSALRAADRLGESIAAFVRATELKPPSHSAWTNLAAAYRETGRIGEAIAAQKRAVALRPDDAESNWTLANLLLLGGDAEQGRKLLDWRWKRKTLPWPRRRFSQPAWTGDDLAGRTIYLHAERSFGDAIHFARYVPLVAQRGGKLIVECQPALRRLFVESFGPAVRHWFSPGEPAPAFDVYCPLLDLPRVLGTVPADVPYLRVSPQAAETWRDKVGGVPGVLNVGIAWAGSRSEIEDRQRSMSPDIIAPLANVQGIRLFSLQKGRAVAGITNLTADLADFADSAALVNQIDLVISVDTAVAHLAGALGKPVWVLLPFVPHWRWGMHGETTPWYPTMRLFRQTSGGDWVEVVRRVVVALQSLLV
ncbi:MAG TPA: tetratricopeptide repeat protein [Tepidisphaeraceae bacterium]|nr:tetratricopeptide repeat protein [Tepidisphaeraceae bacterium]